MPITALYGGLLAILFLYLSLRVIRRRRSQKVEIGDGSDRALLRAMRVHANCAEYAPFGLLLLALVESVEAPGLVVHAIGIVLVTGRVVHAYGLSHEPHIMKMRQNGMLMTFAAIFAAAVVCIGMSVWLLFAWW